MWCKSPKKPNQGTNLHTGALVRKSQAVWLILKPGQNLGVKLTRQHSAVVEIIGDGEQAFGLNSLTTNLTGFELLTLG